MTPTHPIGYVDSALRLLLTFGEHERVRVTDATKHLDVARSTAHRLMQVLQYFGLVRRDTETKAYFAEPELISMGLQVIRRLDVRAVARPFLEELVAEVKETVVLMGRQSGAELICLDSVESPQALRVAGHASASGRALLSTLPDAEVKRIYPRSSLPRGLAATIERRSDLLEVLRFTRERGYAMQRDETEPGVSALSAPIRRGVGPASFAVTVMIPTSRLPDASPRIGDAVARKAVDLAVALPDSDPRVVGGSRR